MSTRIVFMGSPEFSLPILTALVRNFQVLGVVTQPDRPAGRGKKLMPPPVKELALKLGLPTIQPRRLRDDGVFDQLVAWAPDLIVVAAFGQILRQNVLDLPKFGCINVHGSILPRWRGAAPIQAAILAGDKETGITIMKMDAGIDTGDWLTKRYLPIESDDTSSSLSVKLAQLGSSLLIETLKEYIAGNILPRPQDDRTATYAPQLNKENGRIEPSKTAVEIERAIRAYQPWPGSFIELNNTRIKILQVDILADWQIGAGVRTHVDDFPVFGTADGALKILEIQPEGKKPMNGKDFLRGYKFWDC